jgi:hypothetical protein
VSFLAEGYVAMVNARPSGIPFLGGGNRADPPKRRMQLDPVLAEKLIPVDHQSGEGIPAAPHPRTIA